MVKLKKTSVISDESQTVTQPKKFASARKRPLWLLTLGWFLAFSLFLTAFGGWFISDLNNNYGIAYGPQPAINYTTAASLGAPPVGVTALLHHEDLDSPALGRTLDLIKEGGFGFVRQLMLWEEIERSPGVYDWAKFDNMINKAYERGLQIFLRLDRPPPWSRLGNLEGLSVEQKRQETGPPDDFATFYNFAAKVAARYRGKVKYYQIWNEPNLAREWGSRQVEPARYTELLRGSYRAIKAADAGAVVVAAPLAPTETIGTSLSDLQFLEEMYQAGAQDAFDILGVQIYGLGYAPDFRFVQPDPRYRDLKRINFNRPAYLREIMLRHGDGAKAVWASEYGWISVPPEQAKNYANYWGENVDEQTQARYLVEGIERVRREWPWLGVINVWFFRPDPPLIANPADMSNYWGLVKADFTPRPAYNALKAYNLRPPTATIGLQPAQNNPALHKVDSSSFSLRFEGEKAAINFADNKPATFSVKIDGQAAKKRNDNILAENLPLGIHTAEVTLDSPATVDSIATLDISRYNGGEWPTRLGLIFLGLGSLLSSLGFFWQVGIWFVRLGKWMPENFWRTRQIWTPVAMVGALLLYYFAPVPLALLGVLLFLPLCFIHPDWAIGLAALSAPLYMHPRNLSSSGQLQFTLAEVIIVELTLVAIASWGWQTWHTGQYKTFSRSLFLVWLKRQLPLGLPIAALLGLATISLLVPEHYYLKYALREYRLIIVEPVLLFGLTVFFLGNKGSAAVLRLFDFITVSAVGVALFGIWQFFFPVRPVTGEIIVATQTGCAVATEGVVRVCSVFTHPDNLGLFLGRTLPFALAIALFYPSTTVFSSWRRNLYLLALIPLVITLGLSFSRGAWLGTAAAILAMLLFMGARRLLLVYGGFALLGLAALPFIKVERIANLFNLDRGSAGTRLYLWQSTWEMLKDKPLTGYGLDQFLYYFNPQYVNPNAWTERFLSHPHNYILDWWLRLGILGLPLLAWLIFSFVRTSLTLRAAQNIVKSLRLRRALAAGLFGSMVHFLTHGLVDNSYFVMDLAILFCLSFAMLELLRRDVALNKEITE